MSNFLYSGCSCSYYIWNYQPFRKLPQLSNWGHDNYLFTLRQSDSHGLCIKSAVGMVYGGTWKAWFQLRKITYHHCNFIATCTMKTLERIRTKHLQYSIHFWVHFKLSETLPIFSIWICMLKFGKLYLIFIVR